MVKLCRIEANNRPKANMFQTPSKLFRTIAIAEAISWTLLIAGMIIRSATDWALGVRIGGSIHGFIVIGFFVLTVFIAKNQHWKLHTTALVLLSAIPPYATIPVDVWLHRSGKLDGQWRKESQHAATSSEKRSWHESLFQLALRFPLLSALVIVVGIIAVFATMMFIGPPF